MKFFSKLKVKYLLSLVLGVFLVGGINTHAGHVDGIRTGVYTGPLRYSGLGDYVWLDANGNGLQELDEKGIPGVMATLIPQDRGKITRTTQTDEYGYYYFDELEAGVYRVEFSQYPEGLEWTQKEAGQKSGGPDSHVNPATGITDWISLEFREKNINADAGLRPITSTKPVEEVTHEKLSDNKLPIDSKHPNPTEEVAHHPSIPQIATPEPTAEVKVTEEHSLDTPEILEVVVPVDENMEEVFESEIEVTSLPAPKQLPATTPRTGGFFQNPLLYLSTALIGFASFKSRKKFKKI